MTVVIDALLQTNMMSVEALPKIIETSQLTSDLDGTLHYDHAQWIDMRLVSVCILQCTEPKRAALSANVVCIT